MQAFYEEYVPEEPDYLRDERESFSNILVAQSVNQPKQEEEDYNTLKQWLGGKNTTPTFDRSTFDSMTKDEVLDFLLPKYESLVLRIEKITAINRNPNMQPTHRLAAIHLLNEHPKEVLSGQPFKINVGEMRKAINVDGKTAANMLKAMAESGAVKYDYERSATAKGNQITESTISFAPNFELMNTKDTKPVTEARERETKKREERKLEIMKCEHCGHVEERDKAEIMLVPLCSHCEKVSMANAQIVPLQEVLLVKDIEEISPADTAPTPTIDRAMNHLTPREQAVQKKIQFCLDHKVGFVIEDGRVQLTGREYIPANKLNELLAYITRNQSIIIKLLKGNA